MGTNFYVKGHQNNDEPRYHIGKRSAAGLYCWDCNATLCVGGVIAIHKGEAVWADACPLCGKTPEKENLADSSSGRELGFNHNEPGKKTGVRSCSSFTWARKLGKIRKIVDEYGREYTREQFNKVLEECPIQFYHSLGQRFS